jgi:hypothetical protein
MTFSMGLLIIGYIILITLPSIMPVIVGCFIFGYANANAFSQAVMRAGIIAPFKSTSIAVGITAAALGCGFFASTFSVSLLKTIVGVDALLPILPVILVINIVLVVLALVWISITNKSEKTELQGVA